MIYVMDKSGRTPKKDYCGKKFGRLTVIKWVGRGKWKENMWLCKCDCGNEKIINGQKLNSGHTKSCGCLQIESRVHHGFCKRANGKHSLYSKLDSMKQRCYNKNNKQYKDYGGRGISICDEWLYDYKEFIRWGLNNGYEIGLTIERRDNDGNYCPENCYFTDYVTQNNNQRSNHNLTYNNKTQSISKWAAEIGIKYTTLCARIRYGWGIERAITEPIRGRSKNDNLLL